MAYYMDEKTRKRVEKINRQIEFVLSLYAILIPWAIIELAIALGTR